MTSGRAFRIGTGAGFSADRLDPAVDLAARGELDALVFECIGERTLAFAQRDRLANPNGGFNPLLAARLHALLPLCAQSGTRIITNMGVANPAGAAARAAEVAGQLGFQMLTIAWLEGDDVTELISPETPLAGGQTVGSIGRRLIGANAYLGADAVLQALDTGAQIVITGRVADPSLFLAPLQERFGWAADDWPALGHGTLIGHLMECGAQITGGYFADPGFKDVPDLANVGFPIAEVQAEGTAVITKLDGTGGVVSPATVKEQLLYEVHDPERYLTPDVTADFSAVTIADLGSDRVQVSGARGAARPDTLKVTVAFDGGLLAEAGISYAGPGATRRARLAAEILEQRLTRLHGVMGDLRIDLVGVAALHASAGLPAADSDDVRVRAALRSPSPEAAGMLLWEVESLLVCGPAGGGGYRGRITPSVITHDAFLPRDAITPKAQVIVT